MPTVAFITPEEHEAAMTSLREELLGLFRAYVGSAEKWLPTEQALEAANIKARSTLVQFARASAPGKHEPGRITYRKEGTKCYYLQASCIDYARTKQGLRALAA
ncbi:hypothetical protein [Hymenobacter cheonanensis]|uniref:hypothetical protein n=1 Tax=Hymenobacter sp. CA2-7 TaxID=3063993 RepID=UPI002712E6B5|nr:hypothetical protein [Hymenobacter sp. CA2-7]MDO7887974.1 hypothetical protein [Hymenobacter sp. CA2-7]